jgi:hypothetical protein
VEQIVQSLAVAVLVAASAVFATWRLMPARTKLRWLDSLKPDTSHAVGRWVARLRNSVAEELAHGCGACSKSSQKPSVAGRLRESEK